MKSGRALARRFWTISVLLSCLAAGRLSADFHPNVQGGMAVEQAFRTGDVDTINTFNGSLAVAIPLGISYPVGGSLSYRLTLVANSTPWDYSSRDDTITGVTYTDSNPSHCSNAGLGWRVSLGVVTPAACVSSDDLQTDANATYEAPDGSQHAFYKTLHPSEQEVPGVLYTRDGSYLRMTKIGAESEVEFPDGTVHHFRADGRISQMRDRFNNHVDIAYYTDLVNCSGASSCWRLNDSQGRIQWVYFRNDYSTYNGTAGYGELIDRVVLTGFANTTVVYQFNYTPATIGRGCPNSDPQLGDVPVPLLTSVTLPDGSSYAPGGGGYVTAPAGSGDCATDAGSLTGLTLPTLGRIAWTYQSYAFPQNSATARGRTQFNRGVATRTLLDANGGTIGQWTYTTSLTLEPFASPIELVNTVTDPLGNRTVRYFSVSTANFYTGPNINDYGRQYTPKTMAPFNSSLFLSEQVFDAANALRRTEWIRYERDQVAPAAVSLPDASNNNGRVAQRATIYDDGSRAGYTDMEFDGVGHYRLHQTGGTFAGNNTRFERRQWNPARGTYTVDPASNSLTTTYQPLPASDPWVLDTRQFDYAQENGVTEMRSYCYDTMTGFLSRVRLYGQSTTDPNTAMSPTDVLQVFGRDAAGNTVSEAYYGGDNSPVAPTSGDLCQQSLPAAPEYQINHCYQINNCYPYGVRNRSQYVGSGFYFLDEDIDPSTGLVSRSRDTSGIPTSYLYDSMGRLYYVKPRDGAWTYYAYHLAASPSALASILVDRQQNGSPGTSLAQTRTKFDALGRPIEEDTLMPDGTWSGRITTYNALGWKTAVSEAGSPGNTTSYSNFDPFRRPGRIRPPDSVSANGFAHDVTLSYGGVQTVTRTVKVGTAWNGSAVTESPTTTTETYDRFGRLASVTEPSGAGGANVTTTYGYDAGNRLASTSTTAAGVTQMRSFNYDRRGYLLSENYPERSANSFTQGHDVDYASYDSRGHFHRRIIGGIDLSFSFDAAERPRTVWVTGGALPCTAGSATCVKEFSYDGAGGLGKLYQASRYNHRVLGGVPHTAKITYTYFYNGLDGRVSQRNLQDTFDGMADNTTEAFSQSWTYTQLGQVATETYPNCSSSFTLCANTVTNSVQSTYTNGFLTAVAPYTGAGGIQYYPNGMVSQVTHANGVRATYGSDPFGMPRPSSISVTSPTNTTLWASGGYSYDGSGNVKQVGHGYYLYDGVSRLTSATVETNAVDSSSSNNLTTQTMSYDAFGNIQAFSNRATPTDSATNHLSGGVYGLAGNLRAWNGATYDYDELNQLQHYLNGSQEWLYMYDADDERVWSFQVLPSGSSGPRFDRWTLRGLDGKVRRTFEVSGVQWSNWTGGNTWEDYIYRDGILLAGYFGGSFAFRRHMDVDHLGTVRLVTNLGGTPTAFHAFYPFGEEATAFNQDSERMKFTGHERDLADLAGSGDDLDYMHARQFSPLTGRFLSVDTVGGHPKRPQSLNRYAYALNHPINTTDPNGSWTPEIHNLIIAEAFPHLSAAQIGILQRASADVDSFTQHGQDRKNSFMHAMRAPGQSRDDASNLAIGFVKTNLAMARSLQSLMGNGDISPLALAAFGKALHTLTDSTSPSHRGFQVWNPYDLAQVDVHHMMESQISPVQLAEVISIAQRAFAYTFGAAALGTTFTDSSQIQIVDGVSGDTLDAFLSGTLCIEGICSAPKN